jgi:hypothetical protein
MNKCPFISKCKSFEDLARTEKGREIINLICFTIEFYKCADYIELNSREVDKNE